jgi:hypothetical protein
MPLVENEVFTTKLTQAIKVLLPTPTLGLKNKINKL